MFFAIDTANGIAVYEQIVRQVKFAVAREAIKPGEMIPSVRELRANWPSIPTPSHARIASCRPMASWPRSAGQGWKLPRRRVIAAVARRSS